MVRVCGGVVRRQVLDGLLSQRAWAAREGRATTTTTNKQQQPTHNNMAPTKPKKTIRPEARGSALHALRSPWFLPSPRSHPEGFACFSAAASAVAGSKGAGGAGGRQARLHLGTTPARKESTTHNTPGRRRRRSKRREGARGDEIWLPKRTRGRARKIRGGLCFICDGWPA